MASATITHPFVSPACAGYVKPGKSKSGLHIWTCDMNLSNFKSLSFSMHGTCKFDPQLAIRRMNIIAKAEAQSGPDSSPSGNSKPGSSVKSHQVGFLEEKVEYIWLLGPVLITAVVVMPTVITSVPDLLQKSYLLGLLATFGFDSLFVLLMDVFFVLADKTGQHQKVPGDPSPWIGPWEYTGYPKGLPQLAKYISYFGVGIAIFALFVSLIIGKLLIALSIFGPYLALISAQVAYERILENDQVPLYPLVPIVYSLYRFCQLARGMDIVVTVGGGPFLARIMKVLLVLWTFYLSLYLAQIPWFYCTWKSNLSS